MSSHETEPSQDLQQGEEYSAEVASREDESYMVTLLGNGRKAILPDSFVPPGISTLQNGDSIRVKIVAIRAETVTVTIETGSDSD